MMRYVLLGSVLFIFGCFNKNPNPVQKENVSNIKPRISFTFDDGSTSDMPGYPLMRWNNSILEALEKHQAKAIFFATGDRLGGLKGKQVLQSWDQQGHKIANHTFTHPNFQSDANTPDRFESELLKNDSLIKSYAHYFPYFRFPYLKEGGTRGKVDSIRAILARHHYKNGHVTIDASDWYINGRLLQRLRKDTSADVAGFKAFYIDHLYDRATYYDSLAVEVSGRKINHVLLLHHNLAAALFLNDLILHFKSKGWEVVHAHEAYRDPIYQEVSHYVPAGESLIWALAKQSGHYEKILRYPAEDGEYERAKMDRLGL